MGASTAHMLEFDDRMKAVNEIVQVIKCEMASAAVNQADLGQMLSRLRKVTERVDELEKGLAHTVDNLAEDARRRRKAETNMVRTKEPVHGK